MDQSGIRLLDRTAELHINEASSALAARRSDHLHHDQAGGLAAEGSPSPVGPRTAGVHAPIGYRIR